jgi:hypothetical protein
MQSVQTRSWTTETLLKSPESERQAAGPFQQESAVIEAMQRVKVDSIVVLADVFPAPKFMFKGDGQGSGRGKDGDQQVHGQPVKFRGWRQRGPVFHVGRPRRLVRLAVGVPHD